MIPLLPLPSSSATAVCREGRGISLLLAAKNRGKGRGGYNGTHTHTEKVQKWDTFSASPTIAGVGRGVLSGIEKREKLEHPVELGVYLFQGGSIVQKRRELEVCVPLLRSGGFAPYNPPRPFLHMPSLLSSTFCEKKSVFLLLYFFNKKSSVSSDREKSFPCFSSVNLQPPYLRELCTVLCVKACTPVLYFSVSVVGFSPARNRPPRHPLKPASPSFP